MKITKLKRLRGTALDPKPGQFFRKGESIVQFTDLRSAGSHCAACAFNVDGPLAAECSQTSCVGGHYALVGTIKPVEYTKVQQA